MELDVSVWRDRQTSFWINTAALVGCLGLLMLGAAWLKDCSCALPLALLGVAHLGVSVYALRQHLLAARAYPYSREATRRARRGELATLLLAAPYCVLMLLLAVFVGGPSMRVVTGKPVEVRSWSRKVVMPGGQSFTYTCWKDTGRMKGTCPAEARWDQVPRWPEPDHVEMQVAAARSAA